jgi:hypothetical protein
MGIPARRLESALTFSVDLSHAHRARNVIAVKFRMQRFH